MINLEKDKFTVVFYSVDEFKYCDQLKTGDIVKVGNRFVKLGADKKSGEDIKTGDMFVTSVSDKWKQIDLTIENKKLVTVDDIIERVKYSGQEFYEKIKEKPNKIDGDLEFKKTFDSEIDFIDASLDPGIYCIVKDGQLEQIIRLEGVKKPNEIYAVYWWFTNRVNGGWQNAMFVR